MLLDKFAATPCMSSSGTMRTIDVTSHNFESWAVGHGLWDMSPVPTVSLQQMNIILTDFMGTGKTAVGKHLARRLGWPTGRF